MFGTVHRKISVSDQFFKRIGIVRIPGDAAGYTDFDFVVREGEGGSVRFFTDGMNDPAYLLLGLIAVQQNIKFISRAAGDDAAVGIKFLQYPGEGLNILIASILSVSVVDVFQIIQVVHNQGGDFQTAPFREKRMELLLESAAVIKIGQGVVIPFMFDFSLFDDIPGDVGYRAEGLPVFLKNGDTDPV